MYFIDDNIDDHLTLSKFNIVFQQDLKFLNSLVWIIYYRGENIKFMFDYAEHQLVKFYFNYIKSEVETVSAKIS